MPRAKQGGRGRKRVKRNSKSASEDVETTETESVEQANDGQSGDLNESQVSEELNESKDSKQLEDADLSGPPDNSFASEQDNAHLGSQITEEQQNNPNNDVDDSILDNDDDAVGEDVQIAQSEEPCDQSNTSAELIDEGNYENYTDAADNVDNPEHQQDDKATSEMQVETKKEGNLIEPVKAYLPHTFPAFNCKELVEKWKWHIRLFPVDHVDIRNNVFNLASKLAEETWCHFDKSNNGLGTYDLCIKNVTDAAAVMSKIMQTPMSYRYITVQITHQSPSQSLIDQAKETITDYADLEKEIENLPNNEIKEAAVVLLDFMHIPSIDSKEGKEKKRSLFVKYLPEGTTKELINVLFPLAINMDIIKTGKGRSLGDILVSDNNSAKNYFKAYVAITINDSKTIHIDSEGEKDDDLNLSDALETSPFETLPRHELTYDAVPVIEEDETVQYLKRKRDIEIEHRRNRFRFDNNRPKDGGNKGRMKGDMNRNKELIRPLMEGMNVDLREKRSRWDADPGPPLGIDILKRQMVMNEKINSQLAMLHSVNVGAIPSLLDAPLLPGPRGRKDRKRDRFSRERKSSESSRPADAGRQNREKNGKRRRSRERRNSRDDCPNKQNRGGQFEPPMRGGHFGGGNRFEEHRGRGGRFPDDRFGGRGGRFPGPNHGGNFEGFGRDGPNRGFDMPSHGLPFEPPGRGGHFGPPGRGNGHFEGMGRGGHFEPSGRGSHFDTPGRSNFEPPGRGGRFDSSRRGGRFESPRRGGRFDSPGRGGRFDPPGRGGRFESSGRGGRFDSSNRGGHFDSSNRGGHFDSTARGGHFESTGRAGHVNSSSRGGGRFDNQGRGAFNKDRQGRGGRYEGQGRGGANVDGRGQGGSNFNNRNQAKSFENKNNNFGQQQNTYEQQNYGSGQDYGNQNYNYNAQQTNYDSQSSYNTAQTGYNTQMAYNQQTAYNQGSYGTQQNAATTSQQPDYTNQQAAQTGYSTQVSQPVSYPSQANMYSAQQTGYDPNTWGQQAYGVQQQTGYANTAGTGTENYWAQTTDYTAQTTTTMGQQQDYSQAYAQQTAAAATNQTTPYTYNTQNVQSGTEYTTDTTAYANQGFYSAGQQAASMTDAYSGAYSTDTSVYGTPQSTLTTAYNFAQYPSNSS